MGVVLSEPRDPQDDWVLCGEGRDEEREGLHVSPDVEVEGRGFLDPVAELAVGEVQWAGVAKRLSGNLVFLYEGLVEEGFTCTTGVDKAGTAQVARREGEVGG